MSKKLTNVTIILCFFLATLGPMPKAGADGSTGSPLNLPAPGTMVNLSPAYEPALIKGLTVHKDNPFLFDFIVDTGHSGLSQDALKKEGDRLVKYFFACLTIPEKDLWVNLSPYEKDRIIPPALGQTALGRDLLAQDYILKQLTASLIYPEKSLGKEFWDRVYTAAQAQFGTTQIPVNTFNKVWILADKAEVYEHNQTAFVIDGHLKVMLEQDYLAMSKHADVGVTEGGASPSRAQALASTLGPKMRKPSFSRGQDPNINSVGSQIIRQIILPQLEREVNTGKNFAMLRQIFYSQILATWYKKNLKEALLNQVYADKSKVNGVKRPNSLGGNTDLSPEQIYQQYLKAYKKGVFNYIKEDAQADGQTIPRMYFSGGYSTNPAMLTTSSVLTPRTTEVLDGLSHKTLFDLSAASQFFGQPNIPALANPAMTITLGPGEKSPYITLGSAHQVRAYSIFQRTDQKNIQYIGAVIVGRDNQGKPRFFSISATSSTGPLGYDAINKRIESSNLDEWKDVPPEHSGQYSNGNIFDGSKLNVNMYHKGEGGRDNERSYFIIGLSDHFFRFIVAADVKGQEILITELPKKKGHGVTAKYNWNPTVHGGRDSAMTTARPIQAPDKAMNVRELKDALFLEILQYNLPTGGLVEVRYKDKINFINIGLTDEDLASAIDRVLEALVGKRPLNEFNYYRHAYNNPGLISIRDAAMTDKSHSLPVLIRVAQEFAGILETARADVEKVYLNKDITTWEQGLISGVTERVGRQLSELKSKTEQEVFGPKGGELGHEVWGEILLVAFYKFDPVTFKHILGVANIMAAIAKQKGLSPQEIKEYWWTGIFHDTGKLFMPEIVLFNPDVSGLDQKSLDFIHHHAMLGNIILNALDLSQLRFGLYHHMVDIPEGLRGNEKQMSLTRAATFADVLETLYAGRIIESPKVSGHRVYAYPRPLEAALKIINESKKFSHIKDYHFDQLNFGNLGEITLRTGEDSFGKVGSLAVDFFRSKVQKNTDLDYDFPILSAFFNDYAPNAAMMGDLIEKVKLKYSLWQINREINRLDQENIHLNSLLNTGKDFEKERSYLRHKRIQINKGKLQNLKDQRELISNGDAAMTGTVEERVKAIVGQIYGHQDLTTETRLVDDLGFDSLDFVDLINRIEDEFVIEIPDGFEEGWETMTVGDIVEYLNSQGITDAAMKVNNGGIDLNTSNGMQWKVSKDPSTGSGQAAAGVEINVDPAMIAWIKEHGIDSLSPVIFRITPIASIWPLVGLQKS